MKKIILLTGLVALNAICVTALCYANNWDRLKMTKPSLFTNAQRDSFPLPGEDIINLAYDFVLPAIADTSIVNAMRDIEINTGPSTVHISSIAMPVLQKSDMDTLYAKASKLNNGGHYVTAIEIFYGINSTTNSLTYYFLPVCLQATTPPGNLPAIYTYTLTQASLANKTFYAYNFSTDSIKLAATTQLRDTINYMAAIKIKHYIGASWKFNNAPRNSSADTADAKYIIFPFQEIFHMYACNQHDSLTIYNTAVPVSVHGGEYYAKQDLLLTPCSGAGGTGGSSGRFSINEDLGHMVPPDYANITYAITQ